MITVPTLLSCNTLQGFMSKILLIEPDWQEKDKDLPDKFIVKIVTQLVMQKFTNELSKQKQLNNNFISPTFMVDYETLQKRDHNNEVVVYEYLKRIPEEKVKVPKVMRFFLSIGLFGTTSHSLNSLFISMRMAIPYSASTKLRMGYIIFLWCTMGIYMHGHGDARDSAHETFLRRQQFFLTFSQIFPS
ncbi:hypothetical protein COOONC_16500 [Cooperia oncophora]